MKRHLVSAAVMLALSTVAQAEETTGTATAATTTDVGTGTVAEGDCDETNPLDTNCDYGDTEDFSIIDMVVDSTTLECLHLRLEGVVFWLIYTGTSVSVTYTLEVSHYNPDFLISTFASLRDTPVQESDELYGDAGEAVSKFFLELLNNEDVPKKFGSKTEFGGHMSESGKNSGQETTMYSDVEVLGHPGNIVSLAAQVMSNRIGDVVTDYVTELETLATDSTTEATDEVEEVQDMGDSTSDSTYVDGPTANLAATTGNNNNQYGDLDTWTDEILEPLLLGKYFGDLFEAYNAVGEIENYYSQLSSLYSFYGEAQAAYDDPSGAAAESVMGSDTVQGYSDALGSVSEVSSITDMWTDGEVDDDEQTELSGIMADNGSSDEEIDDAMAAINELNSSGVDFSGSGDVFSFCPPDAVPLVPYYLSSLNALSWRFGLPELVYKKSYAIPKHDTELFVGNFSEGNNDTAESDEVTTDGWDAWGNIYPRQGWVVNSDEVKNRAVAAFRAAHVVTREDQPHIYLHPEAKKDGFIRNDIAALTTTDEHTGLWQLMKPRKVDGCSLLQNTPIETESAQTPRPQDYTSRDGRYVYNLWRWYKCAPKPPNQIAQLFTIPLGIDIDL